MAACRTDLAGELAPSMIWPEPPAGSPGTNTAVTVVATGFFVLCATAPMAPRATIVSSVNPIA
jgi:hypothetical protein